MSEHKNICIKLQQSRRFGHELLQYHLPVSFYQDRHLNFKHFKEQIEKLRQLSSSTMSYSQIVDIFRDIHRETDNFNMQLTDAVLPEQVSNSPVHVIHLLDGVKLIIQILLRSEEMLKGNKLHDINGSRKANTLGIKILQNIALTVTDAANEMERIDEFLYFLLSSMQHKQTFTDASKLIEELLSLKRKVLDLSKVANLEGLILSLEGRQFTTFCQTLSLLVCEISHDNDSLIAQDQDESIRIHEKDLVEKNQELLLSHPKFLDKMVKLCTKDFPVQSRATNQRHRRTMNQANTMANIPTTMDNILSILTIAQNANNTIAANVTDSNDSPSEEEDVNMHGDTRFHLDYLTEVINKVEILYMLSLILRGKMTEEVHQKLTETKFVPSLTKIFDSLKWNLQSDERENDGSGTTSLKVQFLRFLHSFCNHSDCRYQLLSVMEAEEMKQICRESGVKVPDSLQMENCTCLCPGEQGLLTKVIDVLKNTPPDNSIRFWLSRAIEGYLRGNVMEIDQNFLIRRNLVTHLVEHLMNSNTQSKEIIQSSFDLLSELIKFNRLGFKQFDETIKTESQLQKFYNVITQNIVDSNMFIRSVVLSYEKFHITDNIPLFTPTTTMHPILPPVLSTTPFSKHTPGLKYKLLELVCKLEHKIYFMYKLITSVSLDTLTQDNVSCLNTTLVFLMFEHEHNKLAACLNELAHLERKRHHEGFILSNLRELSMFWQGYYHRRVKDYTSLQQSSTIPFEKWHAFVDILASADVSCDTSILYHLSDAQRSKVQKPPRVVLSRNV